jgi:hypothetical protein
MCSAIPLGPGDASELHDSHAQPISHLARKPPSHGLLETGEDGRLSLGGNCVETLGQYSAKHAPFLIPANEIHFADTLTDGRKEPSREVLGNPDAVLGATVQAHQEDEKRAL